MKSKYKEIIENMVWSYSRVSTYDHCPYEFFLKYIINDDDQYLAEGNYYAEVGSYVHSVLEKIFNKEISVDDAPSYYIDNFDDNVCYNVKQSIMDKTFESCADYFAELDISWLDDFEILGIEKKISTSIDGYKFIGFIDLLLRHKKTKEIFIIDHKSSSYPFKADRKSILKKAEAEFEKYKHQMYLYCKAVYEEYGEYPKYIMWNHFKEQKVAKIEFNKQDYLDSLEWFAKTIDRIKSDTKFEAICGDEKFRDKEFFYRANLCEFRNCCEYVG